MDEVPPPTEHILRPHHIGLLSILSLAFRDTDSKNFPNPFTLHLYRCLLNEISEVCKPKTYHEVLREIASGRRAETDICQAFLASARTMPKNLDTADNLTTFFSNIPALFVEKNPDENPIFMRRSIFGYFCRRCFVSFVKLSFSGVIKLQRDFQAWIDGDLTAGYQVVNKEQLTNDSILFRTQADKKSWAKPESFEAWEKGLATGDDTMAIENLRRFFEQQFNENNDSGLRQHALLNLVRMHYLHGEYDACRKLLSEAITVSRTSGDRITLQNCIGLLHRLPSENSSQKQPLNEIQPDMHPLEVFYDVNKLLEQDQPISVAFNKIMQAVGVHDHWAEVQIVPPSEEELWVQHAVQSIVWRAAGCDKLATIEENLIMAFIPQGTADETRLVIVLNRANQNARMGLYDQSLRNLLDPAVWSGLSVDDYTTWAHAVWNIIVLRALRRGQKRLVQGVIFPRKPYGQFNMKFFDLDSDGPLRCRIHESLGEVLRLKKCGQATAGIEHLLRALWHSEFLFRLHEYRTGVILLADAGLEFGMSKRSRMLVEGIMPQIICGKDPEQRGFASFTLARTIVASGEVTPDVLHEALPYLLAAEKDYECLGLLAGLQDVQYFLSIVYHNLGMINERDAVAQRHQATVEKGENLAALVHDEDVEAVLNLVEKIGVTLSSRK
ncbi:hypothetical protein AGABI1DRAFT_118153 [Agaricus bisporus var. burnettii JB137-S8]|uniref:Anaphase-promoting complex subunit 5 n=1 Tax=Agaricus bisporus var. burnettii (strain JB137-S8 / ATCC MYA-4627 / FGSC 10392) TaxID=597362 RepID=K5X4F6_AGABU|nr:uncharacterized protein AGABI1DRAFT_118153 [Agaricus bisporus var. burnettii JB137-S8]EKM82711.1 hypothetical protein AGABI1DRAFT_118153 [Agaricus bisporus var. burnettii JB137-S8]